MRVGAEYFLRPAGASQRRYEALRAYFVEDMPASQVASKFGYTAGSVHQMATLLRSGKLALFTETKPGPKGPRKATSALRARVLTLRGAGHSVTEISSVLAAEGLPLSAQSVWEILDAGGLPRLPRRSGAYGVPVRAAAPAPAVRPLAWPERPLVLPCEHAGLLLLLPGMAELGLDELVRSAAYPDTPVFTNWQVLGALIYAKCDRWSRSHHLGSVVSDAGLAFTLGLTAMPTTTELDAYSWRVPREANRDLLTKLVRGLRRLEPATGETRFGCDFRRVRRQVASARPALTTEPGSEVSLVFLAWHLARKDLVYANADLAEAEQSREILAFADYWKQSAGSDPGLLVFDSQVTTYAVLDELAARGVRWLCVRQRGQTELRRLAALPGDAWTSMPLQVTGGCGPPRLREDVITLKWITSKVRQIAIGESGRDSPTLLITNDRTTPAANLVASYADLLAIGRQAGSATGRPGRVAAGRPFNADLDATLAVIADNLGRLFARRLPRHQLATPVRLWRQFLDSSGMLHITGKSVTCELDPRSYHPVLAEAGFADLEVPVPWWQGRPLRYSLNPD
ncbi:MAG TPA: hypothetical protein VFQ44_05385 [Streptosporangiaceae bacterium]|nr:hypothetical protein [Streptosporangiaceae bacterium]